MKPTRLRLLVTLAAIATAAGGFSGCQPGASSGDRPEIWLANVPHVDLAARPVVDATQEAEIKALIRQLADVDRPDCGYASTLTGDRFSPVAGVESWQTMVLMDHHLRQSESFTRLVALGPTALPYLLQALDDDTPTKLTIHHDGGFGAMWFGHELDGNGVNHREANVLKVADQKNQQLQAALFERALSSYTVKVGDLCFVAIGQITNRSYNTVRYQPTACIVINSPVQEHDLAGEVRGIWSHDDPARRLLDSLLTDFSTRGNRGSDLQSGAATRLLYYFPRETSSLILDRLKGLDVVSSEWALRKAHNQVDEEAFIRAVAFTTDAEIRKVLVHIMETTTDADIADFLRQHGAKE